MLFQFTCSSDLLLLLLLLGVVVLGVDDSLLERVVVLWALLTDDLVHVAGLRRYFFDALVTFLASNFDW